jgi:hypothetical protein
MSHWVRLWDDMPNDPKWRVIARKAGRPVSETVATFLHVLVNAATGTRGRLEGWSDEDVAIAIDSEPKHVAAIMAAMQGKVLNGDVVTGFEKRQRMQDGTSTERVRKWRATHETRGNVLQKQVEHGNFGNRLDKIRSDIKEKKRKVSETFHVSERASPRPLERRASAQAEKARGHPVKAGNGEASAGFHAPPADPVPLTEAEIAERAATLRALSAEIVGTNSLPASAKGNGNSTGPPPELDEAKLVAYRDKPVQISAAAKQIFGARVPTET